MIVGFVEGQSLKLDTPVLVSDSVNFLTAVFHFSPEWESLPEKWVHFASGGEGCSLQLQEGRITAEMGLNLPAGEWEVYLHGVEEDDSGNVLRRATTETVRIYVQDFAGYEGEGFPDAPPGLVGELERELQELQTLAEGHAARHKAGGADALSPEDIGAGRVNPNLLDNWYFGNPVNQRGQTEYTGAVYTIDRWAGQNAETVVTVTESGITLAGSGAIGYLRQYVEHQEPYLGKKVTLSVLFADGELVESTGLIPLATTDSTQNVCVTRTYNGCYIALSLTASGRVYTQLRCGADTSSEIQAVKLELGTQQTLAHQENGVWVLNEIPDYNEELLKCCMSTADSSDTYANNKLTAAAVNAVNKAGDKLSGNLEIENVDPCITLSDSYTGGDGSIQASNNRVVIQARDDADSNLNRRQLQLLSSTANANIAGTLRLSAWSGGTAQSYTVLHAGNKPSGSYTGNGSSAYRQINTGGLPGLCLVTRSNSYWALISSRGALLIKGSEVTAVTSAIFDGAGKVQLNTSDPCLNENNVGYTYQVL